ncbi:MAG: MiaB/RimO family radical SAM methylthiotransferase, partial [Pseudomonadota bacterium]
FIEAAVEESIEVILDLRESNPDAYLIVAGCLPLRYQESLADPLPEVDLFLDPAEIDRLPDLIAESACLPERRDKAGSRSKASSAKSTDPDTGKTSTDIERIPTTSGYAYLRIADGCSRKCRYCTIPSIRGPLRSSDPPALLREAAGLVALGARELVLVAQDLTAYGVDQGRKRGLTDLLAGLEEIDGLHWIRLMYLHPDGIPKDLSHIVNAGGKVLPYLDIPFQHVSSKVLEAMGRPWKGDRIRKLVNKLRKKIPGLVLRTTFMVGYPAEGRKEYEELRDFVTEFGIERVGVFSYSPEEGTPAFDLGDPVPEEEKLDRADEISAIHSAFTDKRNRSLISIEQACLVEGVSDETDLLLQGRLWDQAPEVDGILYITAGSAAAGSVRKVRITESNGPDLFGELLDESPG